MRYTSIPESIQRLTDAPFMYIVFGPQDPDSTVQIKSVRELHAEALGPGRRKRRAHFELRDERAVHEWLRLRGLKLFVPSASAALRSLEEGGLLDKPEIGKRYSVYAMLPGDQEVVLVRYDTPAGRAIMDGSVDLPYDREAQMAASEIVDPITRVISSVILDTHAVLEFIGGGGY